MAAQPNFKAIVASVQSNVNELLSRQPKVDAAFSVAAVKLKALLPPNLAHHASKELLAVGAFAVVLLALVSLGLTSKLVDFAGYLYPAYKTIRCLEYPHDSDKRSATKVQWLTYLTLYALLQTLEAYLPFIFSRIPFFQLFKFAALVWLYSPITRGSVVVYDKVVKMHLLPLVEKLDNFLANEYNVKITRKTGTPAGAASGAKAAGKKAEEVKFSTIVVSLRSVKVGSYEPVQPLSPLSPAKTNDSGEAPSSSSAKKVNVSAYVEFSLLPPSDAGPHAAPRRERSGIEGTVYKSEALECSVASSFATHFGKSIKFYPVPAIDGVLLIEVKEMPTFLEPARIAVFKVPLLDVPAGGDVKEFTLTDDANTAISLSVQIAL